MLATDLLELDVRDRGTTRLVTLTGEIDIATVGRAEAILREALDGVSETVVVDFAGVTFMDSTGVHLVVDATALARRRGTRLVVLPGPPHVHGVFELTGVTGDVPFTRTSGHFVG